jgi:hypothetical protein
VKYCVLLGFRTCDDAKLLENTIPKLSLPAGRVFGAHRGRPKALTEREITPVIPSHPRARSHSHVILLSTASVT